MEATQVLSQMLSTMGKVSENDHRDGREGYEQTSRPTRHYHKWGWFQGTI
jgi:hypothetical protein